jgi:RimJ/RimL family protein N-acetyltransferase
VVSSVAERFTIRQLMEADLPFLLEIRNECRHFLHDDRQFTLDECRHWFATQHPAFYIIEHEATPIGYFRTGGFDPAARSLEIGADLHRAFRGRGLAKPAYALFVEWLRTTQDVAELRLEVLSHNAVALGLYRSLGFEETGRRGAVAVRDGGTVDSIQMRRAL